MSRKYIGQVNSTNFVYPNNTLHEYDTEIVHDINNNAVNGTVTNFTASYSSNTQIHINFDYTWTLNGAEPFIRNSNELSILSVHMMPYSQNYYKPWRTVNSKTLINTGTTFYVQAGYNFDVNASDCGLTSFQNGLYNFEVRFISHRSVYPVCISLNLTGFPTPTPIPTTTPTPTPTPTATPIPGGNYTSGATINVTDTGWIKYDTPTGGTYQYIASFGNVTLTNCLVCSTLAPGIPFADVANFTVVNCGNSCSGSGPTPTPTPTAVTTYYKLTNCQDYLTYWSQGYPSGTFNSGDRVQGSPGYYYVISGSQTTNPGGTLYSVGATGLYGCP